MILRSILSAVDFSEHSRHALRWAGAFASRFQCRLTVVSVVDPLLAEAARIRLNQDLAKAETEPALREFVAATWQGDPDAPVPGAFKTPVGEAAAAVLETADTDGADLIVVGTHGLGGVQKWLIGSTTERILRKTQVPVLAVPAPSDSEAASANAGRVSHVFAATDFSEPSVAAVKVAADLARRFSARLTLAHVIAPVAIPLQWRSLVEESDETRLAAARLELAALSGRVVGVESAERVAAVGRPADLIGSLARDRDAQLIVMGLAGGHGAFGRRPGSIAYRVLGSTVIPVWVVPVSHT